MNTDLTTKIPLREHIKNIKKIMHIITDMDLSLIHIYETTRP